MKSNLKKTKKIIIKRRRVNIMIGCTLYGVRKFMEARGFFFSLRFFDVKLYCSRVSHGLRKHFTIALFRFISYLLCRRCLFRFVRVRVRVLRVPRRQYRGDNTMVSPPLPQLGEINFPIKSFFFFHKNDLLFLSAYIRTFTCVFCRF